VTAAAI